MGRATTAIELDDNRTAISIHALRGEGDVIPRVSAGLLLISIHALRGEGDGDQTKKKNHLKKFQSTPSVGRATRAFPRIKILII